MGQQGRREGLLGPQPGLAGRRMLASGPCSAWAAQLGLEVAVLRTQVSPAKMEQASPGVQPGSPPLPGAKAVLLGGLLAVGSSGCLTVGRSGGKNFFQNNSERPKPQASQFQTSFLSSATLTPRPPGPGFPPSTIVPEY